MAKRAMMGMREENETPGMEARSHSTRFLKKAARMSKKRGGRKKIGLGRM